MFHLVHYVQLIERSTKMHPQLIENENNPQLIENEDKTTYKLNVNAISYCEFETNIQTYSEENIWQFQTSVDVFSDELDFNQSVDYSKFSNHPSELF